MRKTSRSMKGEVKIQPRADIRRIVAGKTTTPLNSTTETARSHEMRNTVRTATLAHTPKIGTGESNNVRSKFREAAQRMLNAPGGGCSPGRICGCSSLSLSID